MAAIAVGTIVFDGKGNEYKVTELISDEGGFGTVFKVLGNDGQCAALKTLHPGRMSNEGLKTLQNEASLVLGISHINVIQYDFFHDGTTFEDLPPYLIMEFADGGDLRDQIKTRQEKSTYYSLSELKTLFHQLAEGMKAVNERLVHRDLKPANILISDGVPKITDFGLAKVAEDETRSKTFKGWGTWPYMAPEAWDLGKNSLLMDIYGMGIVFYELATLRRPFDPSNGSYDEWRTAHLTQIPEKPSAYNPGIPANLDQLVLQMIAKRTFKRYQSWDLIVSALGSTSEVGLPPGASGILKRMTDKHVADEKEQSAENEGQRVKREYRGRIASQFVESIVNPIKELCEQLNSQSQLGKFDAGTASMEDILEVTVSYSHRTLLTVNLEILHADSHAVEKVKQFPVADDVCTYTAFELPTFDGREIRGWGIARAENSTGFNILLVADGKGLYGDWLTLHNKNNAWNMQRQRLPEPFAFDLGEIEREIVKTRGMHIYKTSVSPLDPAMFAKLIKDTL